MTPETRGIMLAALMLYLLGGGADFGGRRVGFGQAVRGKMNARDPKFIGPIWKRTMCGSFFCLHGVLRRVSPSLLLHSDCAISAAHYLRCRDWSFRGAAFTFRHYDPERSHSGPWSLLFSASLLRPFLLGRWGQLCSTRCSAHVAIAWSLYGCQVDSSVALLSRPSPRRI